jgi:glycosyltransferase involved in cell wall biosynthesis
MKIAIVHDYLREYGGAERVLEAIHEIWPEAPVYTAFVDLGNLGKWGNRFKDWDIRTSWVQHNWFVKKFHSPLRFLAPKIWESFDLSAFDVVLTSSGWFICRGVRAGNRGLGTGVSNKVPMQICYIHHPPRNLYGYATGSLLQKYWLVRVYASIVNFFMRHYDYETAQKVDYFIANSKETGRRVEKFYRRDSVVIYPPVDVSSVKYQVSSKKAMTHDTLTHDTRSYFLSVGRLAWAKKIDVIIQAANELQLPLKIVGTGPEEAYLRSIAGPTVQFMGGVSDVDLVQLYAGAKATIFCALDEDFGLVPVESQMVGTPVILLAQGGVLETVVDGKTGVFFMKPEVKDLKDVLIKFNTTYTINRAERYHRECIQNAKRFSKDIFQKQLKEFVEEKVKKN